MSGRRHRHFGHGTARNYAVVMMMSTSPPLQRVHEILQRMKVKAAPELSIRSTVGEFSRTSRVWYGRPHELTVALFISVAD